MIYIAIYDYLLLLPYLLLFYLITRKLAINHVPPQLRTHFMHSFWLRMFGSIVYSLIMQFYYGYGDSFTYFRGSNFFTDGIADNLSNLRYLFSPIKDIAAWYNASPIYDQIYAGYFSNPSGNMVMKITAIFSYFSFNRFLIVSLFFGFFSFWGQWKLFSVFDDINNHKNRRLLALATLYTPSIWFWGSGLLKDSICLGSLGIMVSILYKFLIKKQGSFSDFFVLVTLGAIVSVIKFYIIAVLLIALILTGLMIFLKRINNRFIKISTITFVFIIGLFSLSLIDISAQISDMVEDTVAQIENFKNSYEAVIDEDERSKGSFSIGEIDPSLTGLIKRAPFVILSCLYRPFVWESRKVIILFTSLESTFLLFCSLYLLAKTKIVGFFRYILSNEFLFFSFVLSMMFALLIGYTTFNFGTMIRYKIIFLPFFYFVHVKIYSEYKLANSATKNLQAS